jgi:CBS domain-containing protein
MIDNQLLAIPVIDDNTAQPISILSMFNLVSYIVDQSTEDDLLEIKFRSDQQWQFLYDRMISTKDSIALQRLDKLLQKKMFEFEELDPVYMVCGSFPLKSVADLMVATKAHRILVLDEKGHFANVISQTRLLEILSAIMTGFPELSRPIIQTELWARAIKHVESIHEYEMAFIAFRKMKEKKVSGLAVLNDQGVIVGNISTSDIKLLEFDMIFFSMLGYDIAGYLNLVSKPELLHQKPIRFRPLREALSILPRPVVTCRSSDSMGYIMAILLHYRIHRVYVVDDGNKPIGVISLHDILSEIMETRTPTAAF